MYVFEPVTAAEKEKNRFRAVIKFLANEVGFFYSKIHIQVSSRNSWGIRCNHFKNFVWSSGNDWGQKAWVHCDEPNSKQESMESHKKRTAPLKKFKVSPLAGNLWRRSFGTRRNLYSSIIQVSYAAFARWRARLHILNHPSYSLDRVDLLLYMYIISAF